MDDTKEAPTDIRHFEFIKYTLDKHEEFLAKLDNALFNVFVGRYDYLYNKAISILQEFLKDNNLNIPPNKKELFITKVITKERTHPLPDFAEELKLRQFLLLLIIDTTSDFDLMEKVTKWLTQN